MKNKLLYIVFLFIGFIVSAQGVQTLRGKVVADKNGVANVFVINKSTGIEVKTDNNGFFTMVAKPGDKITAYSTQIIVRDFMLNAESFKQSPYVISVNYNGYELDELVIDKYKNLNAESMGIVPKGQKRYTVAERRLYCASAMTVGTIIGIDPIINAISGRTAMLRRAYDTEKKEGVIGSIQMVYSDEELMTNYKIPKEYVKGFVYYISEDADMKRGIKEKNKTYTDFLLMTLSKDYLKLLADDK